MRQTRLATIGLIVIAVVIVGLVVLWQAPPRGERVRIAGVGEVAAVTRADAASELVLEEALQAAETEAMQQQVKAFIVHRRGHRVFEYFAAGISGASEIDGGELATAVLQLALHQPADAAADTAAIARHVSERIWLPLRAADAWLVDAGQAGPGQCCIEAQLDDWLRVADLVNGLGAYQGERVVAPDAVRGLLEGLQLQWAGDESFLARDGIAFDLADGARLWLAPRRGLTMLVWADGVQAHDTLLPNILMRGLNDAAPSIGGDISDLVPGH